VEVWLYTLTSELDGCEWLTSRPSLFTAQDTRYPSYGGWVDSTACSDVAAKKKSCLLGIEPWTSNHTLLIIILLLM